MKHSRFFYLLYTLVLAALSTSVYSDALKPYSDIFIFGDSLSDTGNLQVFSQNPGIPARFTNGPIAVEILAEKLGLQVSNALHLTGAQYGNNFAVAGAIALDEDDNESTYDINLPTQINSYLAFNQYQADQDALYIVMIGGNDIRSAREIFIEGEWGAVFDASKRLTQANESIEQQLFKLIAAGAQNILLVNAPSIGAIPETDIIAEQLSNDANSFRDQFVVKHLENIANLLTLDFNHQLKRIAKKVSRESGVKIKRFNLFRHFKKLSKKYLENGFTNNTDACIYVITNNGAPNPECNLETFIFFDEIHPTAAVHALSAQALYEALTL